ncbi:MAG: DsbC family protein [Arenicellales bacterium WSBS_2016_MAG_OTU3]
MMKMIRTRLGKRLSVASLVTGLVGLGLSGVAAQADTSPEDVRRELANILPPNITVVEITKSPMENVLEVQLSGGQEVYVISDGKFLMLGDVWDTERNVNISEEKKTREMAAAVSSIPAAQMIVFGPKDAKRHVTVFTDIDCGYCRKLHRDVPALTQAGLQVRYMMFPRAGLKSESYAKAVSVWCADDQQAAMTSAKQGSSIEPKTCANPVADQYHLGQQVGVRGTPTMILDDGTMIPGYLPANELLARVNLK